MAVRAARRRAPEVLRRHWTGLAVVVLAVVLVASAFLAPGLRVADVRLQDGAIFGVNESAGLLGTVNTQIKDLSSAVSVADQSFSLLQEGRTVVIKGDSSNQIQSFDPATGELGSAVSLPSSGDLVLNGGKIAVISRLNGSVWFGDAAAMLQRDFNKEKAQLDLGENALVTLTTGGQIIGLSLVDSQIVRFVNGVKTVSSVPMQLDAGAANNVQLSAVGDKAVVLDRTKQLVWFEGSDKPIEMPMGSRAQLAQPVPALSFENGSLGAVVATPTGIVGVTRKALVSLSGAMPEGAVEAPVSANGCVYGVVGSKVSTSCPGKSPVLSDIPSLSTNASLTIRVNGDNVILNDVKSGDIWLVTDGMRRISDWSKVTPAEAAAKKDTPSNEATKVNPDRTGKNRPPVAGDDSVTVRAGRSTILPILDNDSDPDGDVITVVGTPSAGEGVTLQLVRGGAGLQAVVAADATGRRTFTYTIVDGRGGTSQPAHVTLSIESADQTAANQPPVLHDKDTVIVASGQQTQIRELLRWRDPDGDDMVLVSAALAEGSDEVSFTPDGTITFTDVGKSVGLKTINVVVSDGQAKQSATLLLDVRKAQEVTPVANGDFATAMTNQEIQVSPLDNDQGVNLALASVDAPSPQPAKFTVDYTTKTFRFKASTAGTYYVGYTVTNGRTSFGLVRIDVVDRATENRPPITTRDVVLLTHGGSVTLDPLLNDEDPDGDVLVVQSFASNGLNVIMRDRHLMTITETTARDTPTTMTYYVSDGYHAAVPGTIVVIPSNPVGEVRPVATADNVNVRVGDAVTVSPLDNDFSPVGLDLTVDPVLIDNPGGAWVDGNKIRFVAPAVPGRVTATYKVKDSLGRTATAVVTFNVISPDIVNQAPVPQLVTGRVLAGTTQRIEIPLQNIDPNGDSVRLVGLGSGPKLGRILSVGATYLEYQAFDRPAGTDSFTYVVIDAYGLKATGDIRVGVVPAGVSNTAPTANQDTITTRPGRTVYIQPLANDSDPDGDKISLNPDNPVSFSVLQATVVDTSAIQVVVPNEAGTWFGTYKIQDARGAMATGNIVITADPKADLQAPKAFDDLVDAREVFQRDTVDVPVLANDYDPDGLRSDLTLSVPPSDSSSDAPAVVVSTASGPQLRVPIGDRLRVIRYTITDADGLSASAFVTVPGKSDATPWLKDPNVELTVTAGQLLSIPVNQYVAGTQGRQVVVSSADKVSGAPGAGRRESASLLTYTPGDSDVGPAAITFEVVEDVDASVTDARSATLTIRINVLPRAQTKTGSSAGPNSQNLNQPPYAPSPIEIRTGQGEGVTEQNLQSFLVDPEGDAIIVGSFDAQLPAGVTVTMQGSNILASALVGTPKGTSGIVRVRVSDARGADSIVPVTITVVQTTRPLTVAVDDPIDATQGQPSLVDVTSNDKSSLDVTTLTVVNAVVEQGAGTAKVSSPSSVTVTPDPKFTGAMTVRYTVRDATGDPARDVDGRIVVNVRGVPAAPGIPRNVSVGDGTVTATFTSVLDNGGLPVQWYWLTATGKDGQVKRQQCPTTTCTVTDLHNTVEYTLKSSAENAVGEGPASADSAVMVPDVVPDQMAAPSVTRQAGRTGGSLVISWSPPTNRGSAITSYTVTMKTAGGQSRTVTTTSLVWDNLTNGTDYSFSVQATNNSGTSVESPIGTGRPSAPAAAPAVTAMDGNDPNGGSVLASWHAPTDNGEPITQYLLNVSTNPSSFSVDGPADVTLNADSPDGNYSYLFKGLTNGVNYYVAVRAVNAAGNSDVGRSAAAMPYGVPTVTIAPTVVAGDGIVTVSMGPTAASQGATIVEWVISGYDTTGDRVTNKIAAANSDGSFSLGVALPVANQYRRTWQFMVVPRVQSSGGQIKEGAQSPLSASVQPMGAMAKPEVTIVVQQGVTAGDANILFSITPGDTNGHPDNAVKYTYASTWDNGNANGGKQFTVPIPMTATGPVTVTQTATDGATSTGSITVLPTISVTAATALLTVRYVPESPLYCQVMTGTTASNKLAATEASDGSSSYHTYTYSYALVPVGTTITLQCGGDVNDPTTYQITTTR